MTLAEELDSRLPPDEDRRFGELTLRRTGGGFTATHHLDAHTDDLESVDTVHGLRELAKYDEHGEYRPLKTAPTLRRGWRTDCRDAREFLERLDAIYPGLFATWIAYEKEELDPVPLRDTLDRQTGMYRFAGNITDAMANQIMRDLCAKGCVRQIAWPIDASCAVSRIHPERRSLPAICTEACTFAVSEARRLAKEAYDRENAPANS